MPASLSGTSMTRVRYTGVLDDFLNYDLRDSPVEREQRVQVYAKFQTAIRTRVDQLIPGDWDKLHLRDTAKTFATITYVIKRYEQLADTEFAAAGDTLAIAKEVRDEFWQELESSMEELAKVRLKEIVDEACRDSFAGRNER